MPDSRLELLLKNSAAFSPYRTICESHFSLCTGNQFISFAIIETKNRAHVLIKSSRK